MGWVMRTKNIARRAVLLATVCAPAIGACSPNNQEDVAPEGFLAGAEGTRLHYRVVGEGPDTVVVVHGGPGAGMNSVRPDFEPLAEQLTLVLFDQRGDGRSELPADTSRLRPILRRGPRLRAGAFRTRAREPPHAFLRLDHRARYAQEHPDRIHRIVLHGATGPVRERAARLARRAPHSPDTTLSRQAGELLGSLLDGTASDPAETCRE